MKKLLSVLMASVLCVGILAGCGANKTTETTTETAPAEEVEAEVATKDLSVSTDGSTSMEKVIGSLGEVFQEETGITFTYNPTGSGSGIKAVSEGRCDIGLSSRELKAEEAESGLTGTVLAYDGIAIIVNPENTAEDLTSETLAKIYTGEITNWSDGGGVDGEIVLIGREAGSGTRDGFESITGTEDACKYRIDKTEVER